MKAKIYTQAFRKSSEAVDRMTDDDVWYEGMEVWRRLREEAVIEGYHVIFNHAQDQPYFPG